MDGISQAVTMWQLEAVVAVAMLFAVYVYHHGAKVWRAPDGVSLIFTLGVGLSIVTLLFILLRDRIHWFTNRYALYFLLLYLWCAAGTIFVTYRHTHVFKLFIGLVSQAGIVYGLYRWV